MESKVARVSVSRTSSKDIKIRGLEVLIDGKAVADLKFGDTFEHEVSPGKHTLKVNNTLYNKSIDFDVQAGQTAKFNAGNFVSGLGGVAFLVVGMGPYKVFLEKA